MEKVLSKFNQNSNIGIWLVVILFSFLPLLINFNSYPPGDDPLRLEILEWNWYYYGWLPLKIIGVPLYYYSTFLLMFIGLRIFFRSNKVALLTWSLILFLSPTIYLNMVSGAWINIVGVFLVNLIAIRLYTEWKWYGIPAMIIGFAATIFHNESGGYLLLALLPYLLIFKPRKIYAIIPIILGLLIVVFVFDARGKDFLEGEKEIVIEYIENGEIVREGTYESLAPNNATIKTLTMEYWVNNYLTLTAIIPIIIIVTLTLVLNFNGLKMPEYLWPIIFGIIGIGIITFSPIAFSPFRTGIHLVSFISILLGYFTWDCWKKSRIETRWILVSVFLYLAMINLPNSLGVWIVSRA